jgi:RNA polymerase sigma-70 factor (ECF subfamily)
VSESVAVLNELWATQVTSAPFPVSVETPVPDFELARQAAAGDLASFEELYRRHFNRVYGVALRMTRHAAEAEDLTQDIFVQLYRKIGTFRGESAFSTWLHRMAVNQVLMHFRKRSSRPEAFTDDGEPPVEIEPGTENPARASVIDRIALDEAIAQLPVGYRTVFVLHDVEGYEHKDIARMLGVAEGTSKSQLHKARIRLRDLIRRTTALN